MRCVKGSASHRINASRQKFTSHSFSKPSNLPKNLRFFSEEGVTEIFRSSVANVDSEAISDILQNRRFHVAENFVFERMDQRSCDSKHGICATGLVAISIFAPLYRFLSAFSATGELILPVFERLGKKRLQRYFCGWQFDSERRLERW
jgi:hypothetical protein